MDKVRKMIMATESVAGSQGQAYIEIDNKRYVLASLSKFKATFKTNSIKKGVLGEPGKMTRATGWDGTWSATFYYNQSTFRELAARYAETGVFPPINLQIINEDPASVKAIGRQSMTFENCVPDEIILAVLDVDAEVLEEDISGTFDRMKINEKFADFPNA